MMTATLAQEITLTRLFNAPRELVWKAWTDPYHLQRWWGPHGFVNTDCAIEMRVGGVMRLNMHAPDGNVYPCKGTFREIVAPERLVYDGDPEDAHACGAGLPPRATVTLTLTERGEQTLLTLHTRFASAERLQAAADAGFVIGWETTLERLADYFITYNHPGDTR
ncbi:MAG: SRPBCC domain-containing protein [Thiotrichales bacterium]